MSSQQSLRTQYRRNQYNYSAGASGSSQQSAYGPRAPEEQSSAQAQPAQPAQMHPNFFFAGAPAQMKHNPNSRGSSNSPNRVSRALHRENSVYHKSSGGISTNSRSHSGGASAIIAAAVQASGMPKNFTQKCRSKSDSPDLHPSLGGSVVQEELAEQTCTINTLQRSLKETSSQGKINPYKQSDSRCTIGQVLQNNGSGNFNPMLPSSNTVMSPSPEVIARVASIESLKKRKSHEPDVTRANESLGVTSSFMPVPTENMVQPSQFFYSSGEHIRSFDRQLQRSVDDTYNQPLLHGPASQMHQSMPYAPEDRSHPLYQAPSSAQSLIVHEQELYDEEEVVQVTASMANQNVRISTQFSKGSCSIYSSHKDIQQQLKQVGASGIFGDAAGAIVTGSNGAVASGFSFEEMPEGLASRIANQTDSNQSLPKIYKATSFYTQESIQKLLPFQRNRILVESQQSEYPKMVIPSGQVQILKKQTLEPLEQQTAARFNETIRGPFSPKASGPVYDIGTNRLKHNARVSKRLSDKFQPNKTLQMKLSWDHHMGGSSNQQKPQRQSRHRGADLNQSRRVRVAEGAGGAPNQIASPTLQSRQSSQNSRQLSTRHHMLNSFYDQQIVRTDFLGSSQTMRQSKGMSFAFGSPSPPPLKKQGQASKLQPLQPKPFTRKIDNMTLESHRQPEHHPKQASGSQPNCSQGTP